MTSKFDLNRVDVIELPKLIWQISVGQFGRSRKKKTTL